MASTVEFHFDFISPYAYLGWKIGRPALTRAGANLRNHPVLFAALLDRHGHKGPAEIATKKQYTFKHVRRLAHDAKIPLVPPPTHPFLPLLALRIAGLADGADQVRIIDALFDAAWARGVGVEASDVVCKTLEEAGLPGRELVDEATTQEAKDRLRRSTERALERGVFGVPTFIVGAELFWGVDSVPHVVRYLRGEDPVTDEDVARYASLRPSAERR